MEKIVTENITTWGVAKKTKNLKAKPLISVMVDKSITNKFLIDTLEGREPLGDGAVICIGDSNDAWQQMPKKLIQKYDIVEIDADGWMICEPKPDNSVNCFEVHLDPGKDFYIIGLWGEETEEGPIQKGVSGDYICQNREEPEDVWIVRRKIFNNTYNVIS